jgi:uncharacterized protein (DUF1330 family)
MSCYFVARIQIHDPVEYQKYLDQVNEVFARYKGVYLVLDDHPVVLEGSCETGRVVVIRFDNRKEFDRWYHSDEYQGILKHRLKGATCETILVNGMEA